jgi:energy-coupling factor transport system ATP-binding protein
VNGEARGLPVTWDGVTVAYGPVEVLHGCSATIAAGECVALLGPNGAGKTTLTRLLVGLLRPLAGRVQVGDWDVAGRRPDEMARRVGYVFQHADQQLFARTVREDVAFGPRQLGLDPSGVPAILGELGLAEVAESHPYDLPAPLRKLVSVAGVLAMRPLVLVLDEPTAGFDRELRARFIAAARRRLEEGVTVIAVTHDLGLVGTLARREIVMESGRIVADRGG